MPGAGLDVSHRGGPPGFVRVVRGEAADTLVLPDYLGNYLFNTLGNLVRWPRAGLLFIDWAEGHLLHLAATVDIVRGAGADGGMPPAQRHLHFQVQRGLWRLGVLPLQWSPPELARELTAGPSHG